MPDKDVKEYQTALEEAGKANALETNDPDVLVTLGAAQYRLDSYKNALETLAKSEQILSDAEEEPVSLSVALKAMTLYKISRLDEAKAALEQLQKLCKDEQYAEDMEIRSLLAEAEKLIVGGKQ